MNRKGAALGIVAVILALIILGIFLVNLALRECNSNRDCSEGTYCGSDFECHAYPAQSTTSNNNFLLPSLIFSVSIIVAALIVRKKSS